MIDSIAIRGLFRNLTFLVVITIAFLALAALPSVSEAQGPPTLTQSLDIKVEDMSITIRYPEGWSQARYANFYKLFNVPAEEVASLDAESLRKITQIAIHTELRKDHAEAVRRLKEIESEVNLPATFLEIGGWPAFQRQYLEARPQPGQGPLGDEGEMVLVITTAVAAANVLVRLEGWLPPDASPEVIDQVNAIGRSSVFTASGDPGQVEQEIQGLINQPVLSPRIFTPVPETGGSPEGAEAFSAESSGASVRVTNQAGRDSELEIAVSDDGLNIVIGTNNNYHFSTDAGQTFNQSNLGIGGNDPSLAWGQSGGANGTFYAANIETPSTGIRVSTDGGANFAFQANAYTCGQGGDPACGAAFPDQEHIAADRFNVAAGGDQGYSAWRHLDGNWGIVCSADSGNTWSTNGFFTLGDFPRVTVGQDGFVYVVYRSGGNIMLSKFNSCETNQNPMVKAIADQTIVAGITDVACPTPGLDRCNFRNTLSSPMVAVDATNANHVYVAYAVNTNPGGGGFPNCMNQNTCNENIIVQDSLNGGTTWNAADPNRTVTVSSGVIARRFMPWICTVGGVAHVTWFDRSAATPGGTTVSNNSLTDFFGASAFLNVIGNLTAGTEFQVNEPGTADAQCEAGFPTGNVGSWPSPVDNMNDSESCSLQPQLGGYCCVPAEIDGSNRCLNPTAASSQAVCDFNQTVCPGVEQCAARRGSPKYGDYNGNYCAAGRVYMTWASATAPASIPASTNIDAFFEVAIVGDVPQIQVPGSITFPGTCVGSTSVTTLNVCNTGNGNLEVNSITSNNTQFTITTPSSGYPVIISPDFCFPFQVNFTPTSTGLKSATLTISSNDPVNPSVDVAASGTGVVQDINVSIANSGNFGDVCSVDLKDLNLQIINQGGCNLTISNITSSNTNNFIVPQDLDFDLILSPNATVDVPIRFEPVDPPAEACSDTTARTANITITSDSPGETTRIQAVSGIVPCPNATPKGELNFGQLCIGESKNDTIEVCNTGKCNLTVTAVDLVPDMTPDPDTDGCDDLEIVNKPALPLTISKDFCFNFEVKFTPGDLIPPDCDLVITTDDPDTPTITFQVMATVGEPNIVLDPPNLDGLYAFPATVAEPGGLSCFSDKMLVIRNNGTCPLVINGIGASATPPFSVIAPTVFPITLPVGEETLKVTVRFDPTSAGSAFSPDDVTGTLTVMSNDPQGDATGGLCGEPVGQSGVRELVVDNAQNPIFGVDSLTLTSKGINTPSPINIKLTNVTPTTTTVCNKSVDWHLNREDLPSTETTGSNPRSSYTAKAKEGNKQATKSFKLGQCEFKEFILKLNF